MELRQLKHFHMAALLGSITKAAEQLHMAQPAVSISIQKLEEEMGVQLIDRSQKPLALTAEGKVFWESSNDILKRLQDAMTEINDYKDLHKGTIRIGIPPMLGAFLFPYIFKEFRSIYPGIELIAVEEGTLAIQKQLDQGNLDIAVIMVNDLLPNLETVPITTSEIYVCLPPDHILKDREKVPFSALRDQPFILLKENTYGRQMILQECMKHDFIPNIVFSSSQIETILGLVEKGAGITFLLESIVRKHSNVISRPLLDPLGVRAGLAWNRDRYISNASRAFIDFIKEFPFQF